ncbi:unnamed protein product, partial [Phaeothamnion confervicola]
LGRLLGVAGRHRVHVPLLLPALVWKALVGLPLSRSDLEAVDRVLAKGLSDVESGRMEPEGELEALADMLGDAAAEMGPGGEAAAPGLPVAARRRAVAGVEQLRLTAGAACLEGLAEGIAAVLPLELLPLFTAAEAEALFCGAPEVDVELLQRATEYDGVSAGAPHVRFFWECVRRMSAAERAQLVNFCSGRSRLPAAAADFPMKFKITRPHKDYERPDDYLPIAQ